jgi:hypothetical protein
MIKRFLTTTVAAATLAVGSLVGFAGSPAVAGAGAVTCPSGSWDASTIGVPAGAHAGMNGAAVWRPSDTNNFAFRVSSTGAHVVLYTGAISTNGLLLWKPSHLDYGDYVKRTAPNRIVFAFTNKGLLDGVNFTAVCSSKVAIRVNRNGSALPTDEIVIGAAAAHPSANPFSFTKS